MAIDSNGILHVDVDNETFDEILDNVATALMDYRVTTDPGQAARDVGILCTSPNINRDARYKPIKNATGNNLTEQNRIDANYGLIIPAMTWPQIVNSTDAEERQWKYARPTGEPYEYYRLQDFDGYNHKAVGLTLRITYESIYAGTTAKFYVHLSNVGNTDIPMENVTVQNDTIESTEVAISSMKLYLLVKVGSSTYIVNTGKTFTAADLGAATIQFSLPTSSSGQSLKVWALLGNTTYIPSGTTQLTSTTDTMAQVNFVPLNLTSAMEAEKSMTILTYELLPNLTVTYGFTLPVPEGNFQITNMALTAETGGATTIEGSVTVNLRRYASNGSYETIVGGTKSFSGTMSLYSGTKYRYTLGTFTLNKPAAAKVGDEVWMTITITKKGGSTPATQYQTVYNRSIHTMTDADLDSLT